MSVERIRIDDLLALARSRGASDLHLGGDAAPALRVDGRLVVLDVPPVEPAALDAFVREVVTPAAYDGIAQWGSADAVRRENVGAPYRLHAYRTFDGLRVAVRLLAENVPALEALGLPPAVAALAERRTGLVLFTGPTGSGKTTALAALVGRINRSAERVVVTVEDPVEYVHRPVRSIIAHAQVGVDVPGYAEALRGFMRADPDVILIGEMRDAATMAAALAAAETGHLVFSTLHTTDAAQSVDRIVDAFPSDAQPQVRMQLAAVLAAVVSLRLVAARAGGRVAATEVLVGTDAVRAIVRDGKAHQLRNAMATGRDAGMHTLEAHLSDLAVRGVVDVAAARAVANRPAEVRGVGSGAA
jgi:twitching motility protein PilT